MGDDRSTLGRIGDGVVAAVDLVGVAASLGVGQVGPVPTSLMSPAVTDQAMVETVAMPDWEYDNSELAGQATVVMEQQIVQSGERAYELGEALEESESAWHSDPPDAGDSWSEAPVADLGEAWGEAEGDMWGGAADAGDGSGGAW